MSLRVAPFARGGEVGDALVNSVIGWAASTQCDEVTLSVRVANDHAIALYRRHGFIDAGLNHEDEDRGEPPERKMVIVIPR